MVRDTSIEAYNHIKNNGLLSKLRLEVYECLYNHGPMTQREVSFKIKGKLDWGISPRFSELSSMGVVKDVGKGNCSSSGRKALLWDVTSKLPLPLKTTKTKTQLTKEFIESKGLTKEYNEYIKENMI